MSRPRNGLTLLELLVVIAVIAVVLGLILPGVLRAREAANRATCAHNLRQVGLACLQYEAAHGRLPPGWFGPRKNEDVLPFEAVKYCQNISLLVSLLPYLEQEQTYRRIHADFDLDTNRGPWWDDPRNWEIAHTRIPTFLCPSAPDPYHSLAVVGALHIAHTNVNPYLLIGYLFLPLEGAQTQQPDAQTLGRTNYGGVAGTLGRGRFYPLLRYSEGVFGNRSRTRLADISDGTSNTLMLGEGLGGLSWGRAVVGAAWMGVGCLATGGGMNAQNPQYHQFSSNHPGVVQFCFADGAVRPLRPGNTSVDFNPQRFLQALENPRPDWELFQYLAGIRDGQPLPDRSALLD